MYVKLAAAALQQHNARTAESMDGILLECCYCNFLPVLCM